MTAITPIDSPLYRATLAGLDAHLAGLDEPLPLRALRQRAADWVRTHGFPHPRQEAWRFTPLQTVTDVPFVPARPSAQGVGQHDLVRAKLDAGQVYRMVVASGHGPLLEGEPPAGVEVTSYVDLAEREPKLVAALSRGRRRRFGM